MVLKGAILRFRGSAFRRNTLTAPSISNGRSGTSGVMTDTGGFGVAPRGAGRLACLPPVDLVAAVACRLQPNNPAPSSAASCKKLLRVPLITILQELSNRRRRAIKGPVVGSTKN